MSPADQDDLADLRAHLTTARLGRVHEHHSELTSTNDRALAWLGEGAPDGALVSADAQTAGRGRRGRSWSSPPGRDIYASVILRPGLPSEGFGALALAVGVGLREGLIACFGDALPGPALALKWPNDVLLEGRKLAGILCESRVRGRDIELVVGFGVNVHRERDEFEPKLRERATSLALHLRDHPRRGRAVILAAILHALERTLERFFAGGFAAIRRDYEPHCLVLGKTIAVDHGQGNEVRAIAETLDPDGALRVRPEAGGPSFRVQSADVWLT